MLKSLNNNLNGASRCRQTSKHFFANRFCLLSARAFSCAALLHFFLLVWFQTMRSHPSSSHSFSKPAPSFSTLLPSSHTFTQFAWMTTTIFLKDRFWSSWFKKAAVEVIPLVITLACRHHLAIILIFRYSEGPRFSPGKLRPTPLLSSSFPSQWLSFLLLFHETYSAYSLWALSTFPQTAHDRQLSQHPCRIASCRTQSNLSWIFVPFSHLVTLLPPCGILL